MQFQLIGYNNQLLRFITNIIIIIVNFITNPIHIHLNLIVPTITSATPFAARVCLARAFKHRQ